VGGSIRFSGGEADVERYDLATNTWTAMRPLPNAISHLQCCTVTDGEEAGDVEGDFFDTLIAQAEAVGRRDGL
jgi:hypothetical protein